MRSQRKQTGLKMYLSCRYNHLFAPLPPTPPSTPVGVNPHVRYLKCSCHFSILWDECCNCIARKWFSFHKLNSQMIKMAAT